MTHEDAGHYGAKHPAGTTCNSKIAAALRAKVDESRISCAAAHSIAQSLEVSPSEVGETADLLELRITKCQLGLFGYPPQRKVVKPTEDVSKDLREQLDSVVTDERIGCASCWSIAGDLGIHKMAVAAACENLGVKIAPCQLGVF